MAESPQQRSRAYQVDADVRRTVTDRLESQSERDRDRMLNPQDVAALYDLDRVHPWMTDGDQ